MEEKKEVKKETGLPTGQEDREPTGLGNCSAEYLFLFNGITDAIKAMGDLRQRMIFLQQCAEDMYINGGASRDCDVEQEQSIVTDMAAGR